MYPVDPKPSARKAVLAALKEDSKKMRTRSVARVVLYGLLAFVIVSVGCKHPAPATPAAAPTPPPPPAQPTVTLQATPNTVRARPIFDAALVLHQRHFAEHRAECRHRIGRRHQQRHAQQFRDLHDHRHGPGRLGQRQRAGDRQRAASAADACGRGSLAHHGRALHARSEGRLSSTSTKPTFAPTRRPPS